jgi:hypothetical protein
MWGRLVTDFVTGFLAATSKFHLLDNAKAGSL